MPSQTLQLAADNSTFAAFSAWAKPISDFIATCGWIQCNDTGQVVWTATTIACSSVTKGSGSNAIYAYTLSSGPALRIGMSLVITGMTNSVNNLTATITALASGTFTISNASAVAESGSTGSAVTVAIAAVPSSAWVYEIWRPNDALTVFYLKVQYGYSTSKPGMYWSIGQTTNGAGTLTTLNSGLGMWGSGGTATSNQGPAAFTECTMSGDGNSLAFLLFRNGVVGQGSGPNFPCFIAVERSRDSTGAATGHSVFIFNIGTDTDSHWGSKMAIINNYGTAWTTMKMCATPYFPSGYGAELGAMNYWGDTVAVLPCMPFDGGAFYPPAKRFCYGYQNQWAEGATYTFKDSYGDTHNWKCHTSWVVYAVLGSFNATPSLVLLVRSD